MTSQPSTTVGDSEDDFKLEAAYDLCNDVGGRTSPSIPYKHHSRCRFKKDTSIIRLLDEIVARNPSVLGGNRCDFFRRAQHRFCHYNVRGYNITLRRSTVKCYGCHRNIRSSKHTCKIYDLFSENDWLSKNRSNEKYSVIRKINFQELSKRLPYKLTTEVIDSNSTLVPACMSVEFVD